MVVEEALTVVVGCGSLTELSCVPYINTMIFIAPIIQVFAFAFLYVLFFIIAVILATIMDKMWLNV